MNKTAFLVLSCLGLAAWAAALPRIDLGQTPDQVRSSLGRPDRTYVALEPGRDVEVWSYNEPYRLFWLDDYCGPFVPQVAANLDDKPELGCHERARVIFLNGRVERFLERR